jgi:hypothetical protein
MLLLRTVGRRTGRRHVAIVLPVMRRTALVRQRSHSAKGGEQWTALLAPDAARRIALAFR